MRDYVRRKNFTTKLRFSLRKHPFLLALAAGDVHICTFGGWVGILFHSAALLIPLQFQNET